MAYTVNKLSKLSGISVRTLHFYDEIGLLKPAFYGENHYRYYEEEQLLLLQQILFYRELGFPLLEIEKILHDSQFNKIDALTAHKKILMESFDKTKKLIKTIDKTIAHLQGELMMSENEFYYGFDSEKQKQHEKTLVEQGILTQEFLDSCNAKMKDWSNEEKNTFIHDLERIMRELIAALENGIKPSSAEVQTLMQQHYGWLERTWTPNKESYIGLIELYKTPEFRKFYDDRHPKLLNYMVKAMKVFAKKI